RSFAIKSQLAADYCERNADDGLPRRSAGRFLRANPGRPGGTADPAALSEREAARVDILRPRRLRSAADRHAVDSQRTARNLNLKIGPVKVDIAIAQTPKVNDPCGGSGIARYAKISRLIRSGTISDATETAGNEVTTHG